MRTRALLALLLAVGAGGCETDPCHAGTSTDRRDETVHLKVSGTCVSMPAQVDLHDVSCALRLSTPDGGARLELPAQGEADQAGHTVREGGWTIYGSVNPCAPTDEMCTRPGGFRRCVATRVDWHIDLACVDGDGAPVCQAVLTE
jgi:hypothetical protein